MQKLLTFISTKNISLGKIMIKQRKCQINKIHYLFYGFVYYEDDLDSSVYYRVSVMSDGLRNESHFSIKD